MVIICIISLYVLVGVWGIISCSLYLLVFPIYLFMTKKANCIRGGRKALVVARVRNCSEMLLGIKIVKFFGWESAYLDRIASIRKKEGAYLRKEWNISALVYTIAGIVPAVGVASCTLGVALSGRSLEPSIIFGAMGFFGVLNFPTCYTGTTITAFVSMRVTWNRIMDFLDKPRRAKPFLLHPGTMSPADVDAGLLAELKSATIGWSPTSPAVVTGFNTRFTHGSLHAVLGRVG